MSVQYLIVDEENVTPKQKEKLILAGVELEYRPPHPRRGSYKWGYFHMTVQIAEAVGIPTEYWALQAI